MQSFINSENFSAANEKGGGLKDYEPFNEFQINKLVYGFLKNNQVSGSYFGRSYIPELINNNSGQIFSELKELFERTKKNDWVLYCPPYSMDTAIKDNLKNTISKKGNISLEKIDELVLNKIEKSKNKIADFDAILLVANDFDVTFL